MQKGFLKFTDASADREGIKTALTEIFSANGGKIKKESFSTGALLVEASDKSLAEITKAALPVKFYPDVQFDTFKA